MTVNNCGNCPFMITEVDYDTIGYDTLHYCNLIRFRELVFTDNNIAVCDSYDDPPKELETVLPNCPLLKEEINIKYEKI